MADLFNKVRCIEIAAKERVLDLFSGMYHSAFKGKGIEPEDLREYQPGDDIRAISWSKTAQMGRPFVKNFREERDLTVLLIVDISASQFFGSHYETKRERMAEVAALLAFSAIYNQDRVGLILFSSEIEKYIPPKRGTRHGLRLIRELLAFEPQKTGTDLAGALSFASKMTKKRSISFLLSDFLAPNYTKEFLLAAKKNDLVAIRISDPEEDILTPLGLVHFVDLETGKRERFDLNEEAVRKFSDEQKLRVSEFKTLVGKANAAAIEIETKGAYEPALENFFKMRKKLR